MDGEIKVCPEWCRNSGELPAVLETAEHPGILTGKPPHALLRCFGHQQTVTKLLLERAQSTPASESSQYF